jgi:hypothetical protein
MSEQCGCGCCGAPAKTEKKEEKKVKTGSK